jgi:glycosyltransferase involved in cell wall biosynthesis
VMEPGAGVLVPPGDPAALAEAVERLLADEPRREALGRGARELAQAKYSWDDIAGRLTEIYEQLAGKVAVAA